MAQKQPTTNFSSSQQKDLEQNINSVAAAEKSAKESVESTKAKGDAGVQYTIIASGFRNGRYSEIEGKNSTTDIALLFDVVENHTYTKSYNKTSYAVESRVTISDHLSTRDGRFSFTGRITDSPYYIDKRNYIDRDTNSDSPKDAKRPAKALEILQRIADAHQLITLVTEDNILTGYSITNFTVDRTTSEGASIGVTIDLEEFRLVEVGKTVLAKTADPKKSGNTNKGAKQTAEGGAADNANKGKRSPYIGITKPTYETLETEKMGTTDFSGEPGAKITPTTTSFNPNSLLR